MTGAVGKNARDNGHFQRAKPAGQSQGYYDMTSHFGMQEPRDKETASSLRRS